MKKMTRDELLEIQTTARRYWTDPVILKGCFESVSDALEEVLQELDSVRTIYDTASKEMLRLTTALLATQYERDILKMQRIIERHNP